MKPILFNTEMVKAILDGRKTVTRRVIKPKSKNATGFYVTFRKSDGAFMGVYDYDENESMFENSQTPAYQVGDILYVQETWGNWNCDDNACKACYYQYKADYPDGAKTYTFNENHECDLPKWKPSIHMPKEAARIFLRVTDVKAERLQDMTCPDAWDEEARCNCMHPVSDCAGNKTAFIKVWNSTIKPSDAPSYGWDANPWVWVYEFERCKNPELLGGDKS